MSEMWVKFKNWLEYSDSFMASALVPLACFISVVLLFGLSVYLGCSCYMANNQECIEIRSSHGVTTAYGYWWRRDGIRFSGVDGDGKYFNITCFDCSIVSTPGKCGVIEGNNGS